METIEWQKMNHFERLNYLETFLDKEMMASVKILLLLKNNMREMSSKQIFDTMEDVQKEFAGRVEILSQQCTDLLKTIKQDLS